MQLPRKCLFYVVLKYSVLCFLFSKIWYLPWLDVQRERLVSSTAALTFTYFLHNFQNNKIAIVGKAWQRLAYFSYNSTFIGHLKTVQLYGQT